MAASDHHRSRGPRRAFVTGAGNGIGAAITAHLAAAGVAVVATDIDANALDAVATATGARAQVLDVTDLTAVHEAITESGPFHILVNNAGIDQHAFHTDTDAHSWQHLIAVNLMSVFATVHAALPAMQAAGFGRIVNIASEAGRIGSRGGAVYAAAKGGMIAFTKSIARENARYAITANCIAPGPIDTPLVRAAVEAAGEKLLSAMTGATLLGRLGTADEVAAAVAFLASDEASYITGETLGVSGGMGLGA